jgi:hypothetical protein
MHVCIFFYLVIVRIFDISNLKGSILSLGMMHIEPYNEVKIKDCENHHMGKLPILILDRRMEPRDQTGRKEQLSTHRGVVKLSQL